MGACEDDAAQERGYVLPGDIPTAERLIMSESESQLLQLLKERAFQRGTFRLASGGTSDYYIDGKMIEVFSRSARLIGEVLYERTRDLNIDAIGGLEVG